MTRAVTHRSGARLFYSIGLLILLLGLALWLIWLQEGRLPQPHTPLPAHHGEPSDFIEQPRLIRYDQDGRAYQWLQGTEAVFYPQADRTEIHQPHLLHLNLAGERWIAQAQQGTLTQSSELLLQQNVRLTPDNPATVYTPELQTQRLWLFLDEQTASTQDPVRLVSEGGTTEGIGLQADLNRGTFLLPNAVQGVYLPPSAITDSER